jgi:transcription-repair coupling factor (superfamily II helicase)
LSELDRFFAAGEPRHLILGGAPEGHDSNLLGGLVKRGTIGTLLHICADDTRMARLAAMLEFFHPGIEVLNFPSWDCLPYDRVSPSPDIVSRRIDTLTRLAETEKTSGRIVLTTLNAALQRVPPRAAFRERVLRLSVGQRIALDRLVEFLARNGYGRSETVREPGEFAIRGGIADLYPTGLAAPVRLDFFGDAIEAIRSFDPLTQRQSRGLAGSAGERGAVRRGQHPPFPRRLSRAIRHRRGR